MAFHNKTDHFSTIYIWQICFCNSENYSQTEKTLLLLEHSIWRHHTNGHWFLKIFDIVGYHFKNKFVCRQIFKKMNFQKLALVTVHGLNIKETNIWNPSTLHNKTSGSIDNFQMTSTASPSGLFDFDFLWDTINIAQTQLQDATLCLLDVCGGTSCSAHSGDSKRSRHMASNNALLEASPPPHIDFFELSPTGWLFSNNSKHFA